MLMPSVALASHWQKVIRVVDAHEDGKGGVVFGDSRFFCNYGTSEQRRLLWKSYGKHIDGYESTTGRGYIDGHDGPVTLFACSTDIAFRDLTELHLRSDGYRLASFFRKKDFPADGFSVEYIRLKNTDGDLVVPFFHY